MSHLYLFCQNSRISSRRGVESADVLKQVGNTCHARRLFAVLLLRQQTKQVVVQKQKYSPTPTAAATSHL
jgi:hypothetical protein